MKHIQVAPMAIAALCLLSEKAKSEGFQTGIAGAGMPRNVQAEIDGSGEISVPKAVDPQPKRSTAMMPLRRAYDMLNQLEHDFFGITPFAELGEDLQPMPQADESRDNSGLSSFLSPAMGQLDVSSTEKEWRVTVDLPGVKKDDIHIELDNHMLNISAERKAEKEHKGQNFVRKERSFGTVSRTLRLPDNVDEDNSKVKAKFDHGVLHITLEKLHDAKPKSSGKRIEIQ